MISDFKKENVIITEIGEHKDYLESFYVDTFYNQSEARVKNSIPKFVNEIFDVFKPFSKSDLDMITELYKLLEKNVK
jgi:hypothetical protein